MLISVQESKNLLRIRLEEGIPISVEFSEDNRKLLVCSNKRKIRMMDTRNIDANFQAQEVGEQFWDRWRVKFPKNIKGRTDVNYPAILGAKSNVVIAGDQYGNLYVWRGKLGVTKDPSRIPDDIGSSLGGHGAPIQAIALTPNDKTFLSLGRFDGTLCHWTLSAIVSDQEHADDGSRIGDESRGEEGDIEIQEPSLLRELNHSVSLSGVRSDSDIDQSVLVKGTHSKILNQSLASTIDSRGDGIEKSSITPSLFKQPPASLQLEYVFGIQTGSKRNTLKFLHFTEEKDQELKRRASSIQAQLTDPLEQVAQKLYAPLATRKKTIGHYQIKHPSCTRFVGYFVSRVAVILDPRKRTQRFYEGHAFKIGAMAVHPFRPLIATGQVQQRPSIHIWNYTTCGAEAIIQTYLKFGIISLSFSNCGKYLLSIGSDQKYTLQLIDWEASNAGSETGRLLCFRPTGPRPIFWAQFDPFDSRKFVTLGYKHVAFWKAKGSHLSCTDYIIPKQDADDKPEIFTCSQFLKIPLGGSWTSDLLLGSNKGHLSMMISGKLVRCKENAHQGPINCLKYTDCFENNLLILFSGGEDGYLHLWDASLRPLQTVQVSVLYLTHLKAERIKTAHSDEDSLPSLKFPPESVGVQSIDVYQCSANKQAPSSGTQIIVGLRSGDALELELTRNLEIGSTLKRLEFDIKIASLTSGHSCYTTKTIELSETHPSEEIDKAPVQRLLYYPQLVNSGKVFTTAHPVYPIFASAGEDRTVRLWNAKKGDAKLLWLEYIGREASAISFSPDGMLLAVGTTNGAILILLSKVEKFKFGTYQDMYELPNFRVVYSRKESESPVIVIKFSKLGDLLAVSFDNEKVGRGYSQQRVANSFILLYKRSESKDLSEDTIALYQKVGRIEIPLSRLENTLLTQKKAKGALPLLAATHLDFSDDQKFLQICYQPLQAAGARWSCIGSLCESSHHVVSHDNKVFLYWDLEASTIVSDPVKVKSVEFSSWSLAPAILARYEGVFKDFKINHQIVNDAASEAILKEHENAGPKVNLESSLEDCICRMSSSARLQSIQAICAGDLRGRIHLIRFNSLVGRSKYDGNMNPNILLPEKDMGMTRSFSAHSSPVLSITSLADQRFLLTSAAGDDGCIMQWAIHYQDMNWELDYYSYDNQGEDPFGEVPNRNKFINLLNQIWLPRMQLSDTLADMEHQVQENLPYRLELESILGRRAYDRRGNVAIDALERIVYIAGSLVIFLWEGPRISESQENREKGKFKLNSQMQHTTKGAQYELRNKYLRPFQFDTQAVPSPELSCFTMSHDKRILAVGTTERNARIAAWEILTNLFLGSLEIKNLAVVMHLKINRENQHFVIAGVTREHHQALLIVDLLLARKVLAFKTLAHSLPFKIKDIEWVPDSRTQFVTCGIQHLSYWRLTGQLLEYRGGDLVFYKDGGSGYVGGGLYAQNRQIDTSVKRALEGNQIEYWGANLVAVSPPPSQPHNLRVSLLCMRFIEYQMRESFNELLMVAGGDDSHLYLFKEQRIHSRYKHHYGEVTCIDVSTEFILTGGRDGRAVLWKLLIEGNIPHLRRIKAFSLIESKEIADEPQKAVAFPQFNIQSVSLGVNRSLLGTRTGNITEFEIAKEGPAGAKAHNIHLIEPDQITNGVSWMQCVDNEMPLSIATDQFGINLFYLGKRGVFAVWDLKNLALLYGRAFHQNAISVLFWQTRAFVVLVFEKEIVVLDCYAGPDGEDPPTFQVVKNYHLEIPKITDAKLSPNEMLLAVASISGEPMVSIYDTKGGIGAIDPREYGGGSNVGSFAMLTTLKGFKSSVRYLDFSTDNFFLICEENLGQILLFELETQKVVNTATIEFDVEWMEDGLRSSPSTKGVYAFFKHTNAITKMVKPLNKPVVVIGDSVGTIKLFRYPNRHNQSFYQCYTDHIFSIQSLVFSLDGNTLLSSSQADRSVIRWRVIHQEEEKKEEPLLKVKVVGADKGSEMGLFTSHSEIPSQSMRSSKYRRSPN